MRRVFNRTRVTRAPIEDALSLSLSLLFFRINRARDFVNKREESARILLFLAFFPPESTQGEIFGESLGFSYFPFSASQKVPNVRVKSSSSQKQRERERELRALSFFLSLFLSRSECLFFRPRASVVGVFLRLQASRVFLCIVNVQQR